MAIAFARLEFVKRTAGKNACGKAAYNSRSQIEFHGSEWQEPRIYDWTSRPPPAYHEILLSENANPKFKTPETLWNLVEQKEIRRNSQSALELVIALPDDKTVSFEDKLHLTRTFVDQHFIKKGLAAQIDIHAPETKKAISQNNQEPETPDHNWHAHVLITTRRFKENGLELEDHKARDLMPVVKGGRVITGQHWGKLWAQHQNTLFEQKGLPLRVDAEGVIAQRHLGPVRMRARAFSLLNEHDFRLSLNTLEAQDPSKILAKITQTKNIFTAEEIDHFLHKHLNPDKALEVKETFWKQPQIIQLLNPNTHQPLNKFTTQPIIDEEKKALRLADHLHQQKANPIDLKKTNTATLTDEQKTALHNILLGPRLACIEGYAGTGKSNLLAALKNTYESQGYTVRGLGPDSATAHVLKEKGFLTPQNIYQFLFSIHKRKITKQEVWILDEAGKLGTRPLLELLKQANRFKAQLILAGDSAQLPPVERGLGLKHFSDRYGAHRLENIQRQQEASQREIARKLATGEMGQALDAILRDGNIRFAISKEEAIETLIKTWATTKESTLILAHSNREVKALNELARLYRKEAEELIDKEYQCDTAYGKIYISQGDRIEFRKKDKDLGVNNGTEGILINASEKKFTVHIKEGSHTRHLTFDPRTYQNYQLGYATTYYRSQGRAADKVFVLHSPMMNKEMFYVGLTRHFKKVELFISTQDAKNISDLKRQAYRQTFKASTLEYLTSNDLEKRQSQTDKHNHIKSLKTSGSLLSKTKGLGLSAWEGMRTVIERYQDKQPDPSFFNPQFEKQNTRAKVQEVTFEEEIKINEQTLNSNFRNAQQTRPVSQSKTHWHKLPEEKKSLLKEYFKNCDHASSLHTIVKSEEESIGTRSPHFQEWQQACSARNTYAYEITKTLNTKQLRSIFEPKSLEILQERAAKHELQLQRKENSLSDLDAHLKENLESLLPKLFPEGPTRHDNKGLRFGSKGSLAVTFTGAKTGSFYDFEKQQGGGPLQLIQRTLSCTHTEAMTWAKDFLGQAPLPIPSHFTFKNPDKEQEWVSLKPNSPAPSLPEISKKLATYYKETARYPYYDLDGHILFYTLRLEDNAGKKIILPLSYGYVNGNADAPTWSLKGYQVDQKPLYNIQLLKEFPHSKVLLVEGEKTADAASKLFPHEKMICLTWSGGAGAVTKSDWRPLFMRDVIIWPDNDKAGFDACDSICRELRKVGIKSLHEVDRGSLAKNLPPKWDLADPLPQGKNGTFIKDMILRAHEKAVGLGVLMSHLKASAMDVDVRVANQALVEVEEKLRSTLEQKFGQKNWEIRSAILEETLRILKLSHLKSNEYPTTPQYENRGVELDRSSKDMSLERYS